MLLKDYEDYYNFALLSQSSYATLSSSQEDPESLGALAFEQKQDNYSLTQSTELLSKYSIEHSIQNTDTGFSATVFKNSDGKFTVALRGTELNGWGNAADDLLLSDFGDIGGDGIALKQAVDLFNYYQALRTGTDDSAVQIQIYEGTIPPPAGVAFQEIVTGITYRYIESAPDVVGLGILSGVPDVNGEPGEAPIIDVTGHSLGGHLALILSRFDPAGVDQTYTYNAPGFDVGIISSTDTEWFFGAVAQFQDNAGEAITVGQSFDEPSLHNFVVETDVVSNIGWVPGGQTVIPSDGSLGLVGSHSIVGIADSLAFSSLFSSIFSVDIDMLIEGLNRDFNVEVISLAKLLGVSVESVTRDDLYKTINNIEAKVYVDPAVSNPILKSEYSSLQLNSSWVSSSIINDNSKESVASLYALENLNSFAIIDNITPSTLYDIHNTSGELNADNFSAEYLTDRQQFLEYKNQAYAENKSDLDRVIDGVTDTLYVDKATGITANIVDGLNNGTSLRVIFGSEEDESLSNVITSDGDRIYGRGGNDTIEGLLGDDYIEGNHGNDTLYGGNDVDTLLGGKGYDWLYGYNKDGSDDGSVDHLNGGGGLDRLFGGLGVDSYYFGLGDGSFDEIIDPDQGNKLVFSSDVNRNDFEYIDDGAGGLIVRYSS